MNFHIAGRTSEDPVSRHGASEPPTLDEFLGHRGRLEARWEVLDGDPEGGRLECRWVVRDEAAAGGEDRLRSA